MNTLKRLLVVVVVTGVAFASSGCSYNRFVSQEEAIKTQWSQVENQLQRRNDLIPNLVEATKGFAQQERDVFQAIADSRSKLAGASTPDQKMAAANEQTSADEPAQIRYHQLFRNRRQVEFHGHQLVGHERRVGGMGQQLQERASAWIADDDHRIPCSLRRHGEEVAALGLAA